MHDQETQSACPNGYLTTQKRPTLCLCAGVGLGLTAALLSQGIGYVFSHHQLNDPILLGLFIGSLPRGTLYFNWGGLLQALGYSIGIGILSWLLVRQFAQRNNLELFPDETQRTATAALLTSVVPVLISEVDGFQVLIWYGISTAFSTVLAGFTAKSLHKFIGSTSTAKSQ